MQTNFGRCPICTDELQPEGDGILVCVSSDYRVRAGSFVARWNRFIEEMNTTPEDKKLELSEELLTDLQEMNGNDKQKET